ncbi:pre-peptidase C-terminal domain-containing protein [Aliikangiella sp. G2MR2-5]|uniref:pre-peptidase C-terminal domain-containing protein n=1 Tax=Aliikangiella sp. G2MR2-5 TaxID=2788943 RepID=UPI0018A89233|nr:pre-peptidase C-terminal domain-containing protein [Aliikangiella sp. G2MR2-5]
MCNGIRFFRGRLYSIITSILIFTGTQLSYAADTLSFESKDIHIPSLIYSHEEMINFDLQFYLETKAPHLLPYKEMISHYAGYSSISPKVLLTLMEQQTGIVLASSISKEMLLTPFGKLSSEHGFQAQLADISGRLASFYYQSDELGRASLNESATSRRKMLNILSRIYNIDTSQSEGDILQERSLPTVKLKKFSQLYQSLFTTEVNETSKTSKSTSSSLTESSIASIDINNYFQMPFPVGESWTFGGAHTNTGSGSYPLSSLDLNNGGYWGADLSHIFIAAAAPGRVIIHSSCFMEVIHDDGWSTTYYHLSRIRVAHNSNVTRGTKLANYASTRRQALCNGGQSSGPHVHFSLKKNGQFYHLNGIKFSEYQVHTGRNSYDDNCNYFWLNRKGSYYCAWNWIYNEGVDDDLEPTIWPMENGQVRNNINGDKGVTYYYRIALPEGASNLKIESYNGSGDADMYVRRGSLPTIDNYQCRPYKEDSNESCLFSSPQAGDWYIMLKAFTSFDGLSLKTSFNSAGGGYSQYNLSASKGQWLKYWINVPEGMSKLEIKIIGNNGDADLYVKKTSYPSTESYDCRPYDKGSNEICSFTSPEGRQWYIGIHAFEAFSGLAMEASWSP